MGLRFHWSPIDAVIALVVGVIGVILVYLAHPDLHPVAYSVGGLFGAALIYQTGSELSARSRNRKLSRKRRPF